MKNDGQAYLWVPSMLTLSSLSTDAANLINAVHAQIGRPSVTTADQNPYVMALNDLDMGGAPFTRDAEPGLAVCGPIANLSYLPLDYVALIVAFGGEVEGLPVFFRLDDLTEEVPATFPNLMYTTGPINDQVMHVHTWETWGVFGESHKPVEIDGVWYRPSTYGAAGTHLLASEWVGAGLDVLTVAQYQAIQAANAPQLP